jgi:hypothetical protein
MATKRREAVFTIVAAKAALVRQMALERSLSYEEKLGPLWEGGIKFVFAPMDDDASKELAFAIPRDAYLFKAVFVGDEDPRTFVPRAGE